MALYYCMCHVAEQLVHVLEPLSRAIKADVIVATAEQRIEEVGVEIVLEAARVHLHRQFIHSDNGHGKSVVIIVNGASGFAGLDHLGQAVQLGIGDCKVDV